VVVVDEVGVVVGVVVVVVTGAVGNGQIPMVECVVVSSKQHWNPSKPKRFQQLPLPARCATAIPSQQVEKKINKIQPREIT